MLIALKKNYLLQVAPHIYMSHDCTVCGEMCSFQASFRCCEESAIQNADSVLVMSGQPIHERNFI